MSKSNSRVLSINLTLPKGVSKARALRALKQSLGTSPTGLVETALKDALGEFDTTSRKR